MRIDRAARRIRAPAELIYQALTSAEAVRSWLPPSGARGVIHEFDPRPGGPFRMTLVFDTPGETGGRKSSRNTDVVVGAFLDLVPNRLVRQRFSFVSDDPALAGEMVMSWTLAPTGNATDVEIAAENVPPGISPRDHQLGMESSLANLARHVEA